MKRSCVFLVVTFSLAVLPAYGRLIIEDFEEGAGGGFDPAFNHTFVPHPGIVTPWWAFTTSYFAQDSYALVLAPVIDEVTFNLDPGEYVDWAGVRMDDECDGTCTVFAVIGTNDSRTFSASDDSWGPYDTTGLDLGEIIMVYLSSYHGAFDDLMIHVVPEPTTLPLLALGAVLATLYKRRRPAE